MKSKVLVLTGYGINCDYETQFAFNMVGADAKRIHLNDIINKKVSMDDFQILALPGGFSFGDDIASAKVLANKIKYNLSNQIQKFIDDKKLIIGICNGFQALVKFGILPGFDNDYRTQMTTLTFNDSGRFEDRWICLKINKKSPCVFTKGIEKLYLPVRHGEGKFVPKDEEVLKKLHKNNHIVVQYTKNDKITKKYPHNPNGSVDAIAGICNENGRLFGLMPHPEAFLHMTNHPRWTRENLPEEGQGVQIFRNGVEWVKNNF